MNADENMGEHRLAGVKATVQIPQRCVSWKKQAFEQAHESMLRSSTFRQVARNRRVYYAVDTNLEPGEVNEATWSGLTHYEDVGAMVFVEPFTRYGPLYVSPWLRAIDERDWDKTLAVDAAEALLTKAATTENDPLSPEPDSDIQPFPDIELRASEIPERNAVRWDAVPFSIGDRVRYTSTERAPSNIRDLFEELPYGATGVIRDIKRDPAHLGRYSAEIRIGRRVWIGDCRFFERI